MKVDANDYYYVHDHLYSPAALLNSSGTVLERYEYDAYGSPTIWNADFTTERANSNYGNPYLFTGRRVDILDSGSLKIQYNRNRYYDYYSGRWLTHDPLGMVPNSKALNYFKPDNQYSEALSLYEYVSSVPLLITDPLGLGAGPPCTFVHSDKYIFGDGPPPDGEWSEEPWKSKKVPSLSKWLQLRAEKMIWWVAATGGVLANLPEAASFMANFLRNEGRDMRMSYHKMLVDSRPARKRFFEDLNIAAREAERLVSDPMAPGFSDESGVRIVQDGHSEHFIDDPTNWHWAIGHYHTWGRGKVRKGKGRRSCCYNMTWTSNLWDNYEWDEISHHRLWELHVYGFARHFKTRGDITVTVTWIKDFDWEDNRLRDLDAVARGFGWPIFPQCQ